MKQIIKCHNNQISFAFPAKSDSARKSRVVKGSDLLSIPYFFAGFAGNDTMKDSIYQRSFTEEEYDEYLLNTPLEARFDYLTIQSIVTEGFEKHQAYGMSFGEYRIQRSRLSNYDETTKKRLSYYLPPFYARIAADLAFINHSSVHHFMIMMIELGLIHFQVDYHDDYIIIKEGRTKLFNQLETVDGENNYMQLDKQTITLGSCTGAKFGTVKHFVPSVPEWLYNATTEVSKYLNMSGSDLVFLSFCIGIINCLEENRIPYTVTRNAKTICNQFDYEIKVYSKRILQLLTI